MTKLLPFAVSIMSSIMDSYTHVVVGGGIAGVSCVEMLSQMGVDRDEDSILLITATPAVKTIRDD
jgi:uncharacterized protein related to proFAR isomerase